MSCERQHREEEEGSYGSAPTVQDKQFQLISVRRRSGVPAESVKAFLQRKQAEGYMMVGLEQTANRVGLDEFAFRKKTVVVLGREKEGIPVDIIQEAVDVCVEIPQLVVLRSLNVHVSASTRQQRARSSSSSLL